MSNQKQAVLVVYVSINGRDNWHPISQDEVPAWVKEPGVMGRLVAGDMCCDTAEGNSGSLWYRAEKA